MSSFAAVPTLDRKNAHKIPTKIHLLKEQPKIAEHLHLIDNKLDQLKTKNQSKLKHLQDLKKSLLEQAFQGKL